MNRRQWMNRSGFFGLGLSTFNAWADSKDISSEMQALSLYMSQAAQNHLPDDVAQATKFHILDTFAAIVSGSKLLPGEAAFRYTKQFSGKGARTVMASRWSASTIDAALVNGVMGHADETDDSHGRSRSHPGCAVIPAAFAAGEEFNVSGTHFMRSVALGYDVGTRVMMAMGGPKFSYTSHKSSHSIAGVFGAAAAAGCVANLNLQQMRWLLDYTSQQSSGIAAWGRDVDHIEKAFVFGGMPARSGTLSALLVKAGWTGISDVFSGADNFFQAYAPNANRELIIDKLGERFEIIQTDIKKWTVGSPIQGPLDAIALIQERSPFQPDEVEKISVHLEPSVSKVVNNRDMPDVCLQHMVAVMVLDKTASFKAAHDVPRMKSIEVLRIRERVELISDEALTEFLPVRVALVEVRLRNGERLMERVDSVRGTPRNPMTQDEVFAKAQDLLGPVLGLAKSKRLIQSIDSLEKIDSIRKLAPLLQT
jgi:2-methylcitrate dehydratase PrpD